jgi:hypothetical protein
VSSDIIKTCLPYILSCCQVASAVFLPKDGAPAIATTARYTLPSRKQLIERVQLGHRLNGKGKKCMAKVVVLLSPTQQTKLLQIPENFSEREITRHYSLSSEELAVIEQHRRPQNRLGFTVQLAYLRFPGRPWDPQEQVPPAILAYLAEQIGEAPDVLADYATRDPTRREHLSLHPAGLSISSLYHADLP